MAIENGSRKYLETYLLLGNYWVQVAVETPEGERTTLDTVEVIVSSNLETTTTYDGRTSNQKELEAVDKAIADILHNGVSSYHQRAISHVPGFRTVERFEG